MALVAQRPEETTDVLVHHFNAGDIDQLIAAYYAEGAIFATAPGTSVSGADLRAVLQTFLSPGASITATTRRKLVVGDTALLVIDWVIEGTDASGQPTKLPGTSADVVRQGGDGLWRCVIDNPHGTS